MFLTTNFQSKLIQPSNFKPIKIAPSTNLDGKLKSNFSVAIEKAITGCRQVYLLYFVCYAIIVLVAVVYINFFFV